MSGSNELVSRSYYPFLSSFCLHIEVNLSSKFLTFVEGKIEYINIYKHENRTKEREKELNDFE